MTPEYHRLSHFSRPRKLGPGCRVTRVLFAR